MKLFDWLQQNIYSKKTSEFTDLVNGLHVIGECHSCIHWAVYEDYKDFGACMSRKDDYHKNDGCIRWEEKK